MEKFSSLDFTIYTAGFMKRCSLPVVHSEGPVKLLDDYETGLMPTCSRYTLPSSSSKHTLLRLG